MKVILSNAFSLNMLNVDIAVRLNVGRLSLSEAADLINENILVENSIGHVETDTVVRALLASEGAIVPPGVRSTVSLTANIWLLVAQYVGPRLPEGATTLPPGARIDWFVVAEYPS